MGGNFVMENWGFVAPYKSQLMATWMEEMRNAWQMGPELYDANIPPPVHVSSELRDWLPYLTMHACFVVAWTLVQPSRTMPISNSCLLTSVPESRHTCLRMANPCALLQEYFCAVLRSVPPPPRLRTTNPPHTNPSPI